jgi:hypothetical protein
MHGEEDIKTGTQSPIKPARPLSEPRKHHYIPVCYLTQWAKTADGRLCEHKFIPGYGVKPRRTSPKGTGYQIDLYRIHGVSDELSQDFEKRFMRLVDTDASRALDKILSGEPNNWPGKLRSGWTRFILSLLFRNPEAVGAIKSQILAIWKEGVAEIQADYTSRRRPTDPETFEEFYAKINPDAAHLHASNFLAEIIDNENIGPVIFEMNWSRIDLSKSAIQLLTSDRPLDMPLGLGQPNAYIALPVSPRILFIAAHDPEIAKTVSQTNPTEIVRKSNQRVIEQARRFVWGTTDAQLTFIRKHFGKATDRELLTVQQRQKAIEAAQGKAETAGIAPAA